MTIKDNIIAMVKELQITPEELGIEPKVNEVKVKDNRLIEDLKEMILCMELDHEEIRDYISEDYWDELGIREKPKYKVVECNLQKTIYKKIKVVMPEDESAEDAYCYIDDYPDNDYPDDEEDWEIEYTDIQSGNLTADEIRRDYSSYEIWNFDNFEE